MGLRKALLLTIAAYGIPAATLIFDAITTQPTQALSSRKVKSSFVGTGMPVSGGLVTGFNDQIGTNNGTAGGSPAVDTGGVNGNTFATMDGVGTKFTFSTAIVCAGDFDYWAGLVLTDVSSAAACLLGRTGNAAAYLRPKGSAGNQIDIRTDAGSNISIVPTTGWKKGSHVWRFKRSSGVMYVYIDGFLQGSSAFSGTCTFNGLGTANSAAWLKGGIIDSFLFNGSVLAGSEETALLADMTTACRSPIYVSNSAGSDSNGGYNSTIPYATISGAGINTLAFQGGQSILLKSGDTFTRDQIFTAQANAAGQAGNPVSVNVYGGTSPAILDGSEVITGLTNVSGDVWNKTSAGSGFGGAISPAVWLISGGVTYKLDNAPGGVNTTFGSLLAGQSAVSGTTLQICMPTALTGVDPNTITVKHARSVASQSDDNLHNVALYWTYNNIKSMYSANDGIRINGAGSNAVGCIAWYNASDGFGFGSDGTVKNQCISCDSRFNGSGDTSLGSLGDGYSAHGASWVELIGCNALSNDKSSYNHEGTTKIVQTNCVGASANLTLCFLDQPNNAKPGNWIITGGSYSRKSGSAITWVVGMLSTDGAHGGDGTAGGGTITMAGVTLIDPDNLIGNIFVYGPNGCKGDVTATGTIFVGQGIHSQNGGTGTFAVA